MRHLVSCSGCARHVRATESICPFCGETLPLSLRSGAAPRWPTKRIGRAATFAFELSIVTALLLAGIAPASDPAAAMDVAHKSRSVSQSRMRSEW